MNQIPDYKLFQYIFRENCKYTDRQTMEFFIEEHINKNNKKDIESYTDEDCCKKIHVFLTPNAVPQQKKRILPSFLTNPIKTKPKSKPINKNKNEITNELSYPTTPRISKDKVLKTPSPPKKSNYIKLSISPIPSPLPLPIYKPNKSSIQISTQEPQLMYDSFYESSIPLDDDEFERYTHRKEEEKRKDIQAGTYNFDDSSWFQTSLTFDD